MLAAARRWQLQWCWAQATPDIAALELTSSVPGTYLGDALVVYAEQHAQRGAPLGSAPARHRPWQHPWHRPSSAAPLAPPTSAAPRLGSCASSGRAWRLQAARHFPEEAGPLCTQPLPGEADSPPRRI